MLYELIYNSIVKDDALDDAALQAISTKAGKRNRELDITGEGFLKNGAAALDFSGTETAGPRLMYSIYKQFQANP